MPPLSPRCLLWVGFVFSLLAAMVSGLEMAFNVYALALKETFNFTQTQVEVVACMATTGLALSCLEAVFTWMFGFKVTYLIIGIGVPLSSGLFSLAAYYRHVFHHWPSVVCVIQLLLATTNCDGFFAVSRVYVECFPKKHMGKLVGLYMAVCCFGKIFFAGLVDMFFKEDLCGFFLCVSALSAISYIGCFLCTYPIVSSKEKQNELGLHANTEDKNGVDIETEGVDNKTMLTSLFFHVTFWSSVLFFSCGTTVMNNISTLANSIGMPDPLQIVALVSFVICVNRLLFGGLFDKYSSEWCGFTLLVVTYMSFISAMTLSLYVLDTSYMVITTILFGVAMAPGLTIPVSVLLLRFGRSHYSAVAGSFYTVSGSCQILLQLLIGFCYDAKIREHGSTGTTCYGRDCFYWPFIVMSCVTVAVTVVQTFNFVVPTYFSKLKECLRRRSNTASAYQQVDNP